MKPRFVGRLGLADAVTVANAALGFLAAVAATVDPALAARVILLAAIADALDGIVARKVGSTPAGEYLDSLADVASFGVAPAIIAVVVARDAWTDPARVAVVVAVGAVFVAMAVVRLGFYTAYDVDNEHTEGVQTTLAGTIVAAVVLAGLTDPLVLVVLVALFTALMVTDVEYPDLRPRHALGMGVVQAGAVLVPTVLSRAFPRLLLACAVGYLLFAPLFYRNG